MIHPGVLVGAAAIFTLVTLGYLGATAYWLTRDEIRTTAEAERQQLETYYQDRIDLLRAEIERLSSRQMVDRESVELQVSDLVRRQQALSQRHEIVTGLMMRAEQSGISIAAHNPVPTAKPERNLDSLAGIDEDASAIGGEPQPVKDPVEALGLRSNPETRFNKDGLKPTLDLGEQAAIDAVGANLAAMGYESNAVLDALSVATENQIERILAATRTLGVKLLKPGETASTAIGGPFVPISGSSFKNRVLRTDRALSALHSVKNRVRRLPLARPLKNARISSHFGPRVDPFLKRLAMHTGMDFKAPYGSRVYASAPGTVVHAGRKGGYGKLVEIRHAGGYKTRYAHLSRMHVAEGDHIVAGDVIGNIGSTGRSTGPHLHYEIRQADKPLDPAAFVTAGDRIAKFLAN
jgi:murein DD-endopeptidase MepM/ murein hydrolase activator NlpD